MDSSSRQNQEMSSESLGSMVAVGPKSTSAGGERKPRPQAEQALKCPRCDSANTKFCYYNNYSLTQPRYFCKGCRRYWTKGGTLRNVPVGGGCRKNRRSSSSNSNSSNSSSSAAKRTPHDHLIHAITNPTFSLPPPPLGGGGVGGYDQNDLALAFARLHKSSFGAFEDQIQLQTQPQQQHHLSVFGINPTASGFLESSSSSPSSSHNNNNTNINNSLYYGFGGNNSTNNSMGYDENDQIAHQAMSNVIKHENSTTIVDHNNRMLWGWQLNGSSDHSNGINIGVGSGNSNNMVDFDSSTTTGRESWTGFASSWHGLLNTTPLM